MIDVELAATPFEMELHEKIAATYANGSGTVWRPAAEFLETELGLPRGQVGLISVTEENVINNRPLSAGLITKPRTFLVVVVDPIVGLQREEDAIAALIPKTRHLTTVGLAGLIHAGDGTDNIVWRVQRLIEVKGVGIADDVANHFPLVKTIRREQLVPIGTEEIRGPWLMSSDKPVGATIHLTIPGLLVKAGRISPGDQVLLCNASLSEAHAAGVVRLVQTASDDIGVTIERVAKFPAPVSLEIGS